MLWLSPFAVVLMAPLETAWVTSSWVAVLLRSATRPSSLMLTVLLTVLLVASLSKTSTWAVRFRVSHCGLLPSKAVVNAQHLNLVQHNMAAHHEDALTESLLQLMNVSPLEGGLPARLGIDTLRLEPGASDTSRLGPVTFELPASAGHAGQGLEVITGSTKIQRRGGLGQYPRPGLLWSSFWRHRRRH